MSILRELLNEIESDNNLEKIKILCDQIFEEEKKNQKYINKRPVGPNLFLVLEVPGRLNDEIAFLGLERESKDLYLNVMFTTNKKEMNKDDSPIIKRQRVWEIKDYRPEKILINYAKQYKILIGE